MSNLDVQQNNAMTFNTKFQRYAPAISSTTRIGHEEPKSLNAFKKYHHSAIG
jgi:hypothetical protein